MNATDFPADAPDAPDDLDAAFPFDLPPLVEGDPVDVVILGAGVNGAGLFRDLCAQGVSCLIVDRGDFGGGASAAGSRLIEGGLAELEIGDLAGARQAASERNRLLKNAPHFVDMLPVVFPVFSWLGGLGAALATLFGTPTAPRQRGAILARLGLALHNRFATAPVDTTRHQLLSRQAAGATFPELASGITAAGLYQDARITAPERLVYELVKDGLEACPDSRAANWTRLVSCFGGGLSFESEDGTDFAVRPTLVVNAAGPWIDEVNAALGAPEALIAGRRQSHILLDHEALRRQLDGRVLRFEMAGDGRVLTAQDYLGRVLVGAADAPTDDPDEARCPDDDIAALLDALRAVLPDLDFAADQVVCTYARTVPSPAPDDATGQTPRRGGSTPVMEADGDRPVPILSLVGGRFTTYRQFVETATDAILQRLQRSRVQSTEHLAIGGGRNYPGNPLARSVWLAEASVATWLDEPRLETLLERYGTTALSIAHHICDYVDADRLPDARSVSLREIDWIARNEDVVRLEDIVLRRLNLGVAGLFTARDIEAIAIVAASALKWSPERRAAEIEAVTTLLRDTRRMRI